MMCRLLQVSRSGYYDWNQRAESARSIRDRELRLLIRQIHLESNGVYGARKVRREMLVLGEGVGRHRVARLMRENGLKARQKTRFKKTTDSNHAGPVAPNVLSQDFTATGPNEKWGVDISYVWTAEGWLYLAIVLDLFSRRIVGWSMSDRMKRGLAMDALQRAIALRTRPRAAEPEVLLDREVGKEGGRLRHPSEPATLGGQVQSAIRRLEPCAVQANTRVAAGPMETQYGFEQSRFARPAGAEDYGDALVPADIDTERELSTIELNAEAGGGIAHERPRLSHPSATIMAANAMANDAPHSHRAAASSPICTRE